MNKIITTFLIVVFTVINSLSAKAQLENLTFELRVQNFQYIDDITNTDPMISGLWNEMQYDLYIQQTNTPGTDAEKMRFALGQYYWNINFGEGLTVADTTGGYATYSYIPGSTTFTNTNAVPTSPSFLGKSTSADIYDAQGYPVGPNRSQIRTNSNVALGNTSDVQVSTTYPGTKVGRYKFRRKAGYYFLPVSTHMRFRLGPLNVNSTNPFTKVFAYNGLGGLSTEVTTKGTYIMDTLNNPPPIQPSYLNLSVLPQGYYNPNSNSLKKKANLTVNFRSSISPYPVVISRSFVVDSISLTGYVSFYGLSPGSYFLAVTHWNSIETWSSTPINYTGDIISYDFTSSLNSAFGNNMKLVDTSPIRYGIYSGDTNQDGIIDAFDLSSVENNAIQGLTGNLITDLTGDNYTDSEDLAIVENNSHYGVSKVVP